MRPYQTDKGESSPQNTRELLANYHSYLKTAAYSFAGAIPGGVFGQWVTFYHRIYPDELFTGSVGGDIVVGALSFASSLALVSYGVDRLLEARRTEKKMGDLEDLV